MTTCGSNTRKTSQDLQKQFSRLARASVTYGPFYATKVYGLQGTDGLLLPSLFTTLCVKRIRQNRVKRRSWNIFRPRDSLAPLNLIDSLVLWPTHLIKFQLRTREVLKSDV
jgi:hypothetical protein